MTGRARLARRARSRGLTLLEVMVSVAIIALIATLVYGAFDGMQKSRDGLASIDDRYHQGRGAISRMSRELSAAFLSMHVPLVASQATQMTAFAGKDSNPDRVDFTSFSHLRFGKNTHESDQNELGYFASPDPDVPNKIDLVRRESRYIDLLPKQGGVINVLAENIQKLDFQYLDPILGQWVDNWDSTQAAGQTNRLPAQVKITLELKGVGPSSAPIRFVSRASIPIQSALSFAIPRPSP
jgi:general secretion pathway protein J